MDEPENELCRIPPHVFGEEPISLTFRITFYKSRDLLCHDGKHHTVGIKCPKSCHDPMEIAPLDGAHGLTIDNMGERVKAWVERRALLSVALALADAQFAEMLPDHNVVPK
jgi:hypothetical protein